jgi:hypothetical protein
MHDEGVHRAVGRDDVELLFEHGMGSFAVRDCAANAPIEPITRKNRNMGLFGWPFRAKRSEREAELSRSHNAARREVLQLALRESLQRHGIPTSWITADALAATSRNSDAGLHWRLAIKHWDTRLVLHGVALQHSLVSRVLMYDPKAHDWLIGISWQYALPDDSVCPAMPHPGSWTADPPAQPVPTAASWPGGSADVITGPVRIHDDGVKSDLEQLMAVRDADFQAHAERGFESTQQMFAKTQPSDL